MRSIRKFAYAAVLGLSIFTVLPSVAAAEDARGVFTLSHEVHWQNYVIAPGRYVFTLKSSGPQTLLTLQGLNGTGTTAMMMVSDIESRRNSSASKLVLVSREGKSFVSTMELPDYDMSLRFAVPADTRLK